MRKIYEKPSGTQRPCFAILKRTLKWHDWQSDFVGDIVLEDPRYRYTIGVSIGFELTGEQILRLYLLRPLHLYKRPVTPGKLEGVRP
jgi:hypothetical protein